MVAEPWDAAGTYELGRAWPGRRWMQWNDRFRDDVRGFLRGEGGLVAALMQRIQGSPDLFDAPTQTVNFLTCHDGFTMYDLVAYDRKHNEANGHGNPTGAGDNRSWNCGLEGDDGAPGRRRSPCVAASCATPGACWRCRTATPMVAMGDEFGRTQGGNNNAYNQDNATSWVDWDAPRRVRRPRALRRRACWRCATVTRELAQHDVVGRRRAAGSARRGRPTPVTRRARWPGTSATSTSSPTPTGSR